jgi:hypothetical protein
MDTTDWKDKSIQRSKEIKFLKKKIKELIISRDDWKIKSISHKTRADKLAAELKKMKIKLNEIVTTLLP